VTDKRRYERGRRIKDEELSIEEANEEHIIANIREYTIDINLPGRVLTHNCEDWRKGLGIKRICKHVCKLFLSLPEEQSVKTVRDIIENKRKWTFKYS
jgi:hypothetical protein